MKAAKSQGLGEGLASLDLGDARIERRARTMLTDLARSPDRRHVEAAALAVFKCQQQAVIRRGFHGGDVEQVHVATSLQGRDLIGLLTGQGEPCQRCTSDSPGTATASRAPPSGKAPRLSPLPSLTAALPVSRHDTAPASVRPTATQVVGCDPSGKTAANVATQPPLTRRRRLASGRAPAARPRS